MANQKRPFVLDLMIILCLLSSCVSKSSPLMPVQTATQTHPPTSILSTVTPIPSPTQTVTLTPPATLGAEQAKEAIRTLLQESEDCEAPCFWGIVPDQTTMGEAKNIFARFGLRLENTKVGTFEFYGIDYDFDSGLSIDPTLTVQNGIVKNLRVHINPEPQRAEINREWSAYSPETLINRYGTPSKVDFFFGGAAPNPSYAMDLYFDSKDLIIEYYSYDLGPNLQVCPLIDQMDSVRVWMGENPVNPPPDAVLLEKATSMTIEEFIELMTGDPNEACFNLNIEAFQ